MRWRVLPLGGFPLVLALVEIGLRAIGSPPPSVTRKNSYVIPASFVIPAKAGIHLLIPSYMDPPVCKRKVFE